MLNEWPDLPESILTKYNGVSPMCHSPAECSHTLIWFNHGEDKAREDGLMLPLKKREHKESKVGKVWQIHGNPVAEKLSHMLGQVAWEKHLIAQTGCSEDEARNQFEARYGESYL